MKCKYCKKELIQLKRGYLWGITFRLLIYQCPGCHKIYYYLLQLMPVEKLEEVKQCVDYLLSLQQKTSKGGE